MANKANFWFDFCILYLEKLDCEFNKSVPQGCFTRSKLVEAFLKENLSVIELYIEPLKDLSARQIE